MAFGSRLVGNKGPGGDGKIRSPKGAHGWDPDGLGSRTWVTGRNLPAHLRALVEFAGDSRWNGYCKGDVWAHFGPCHPPSSASTEALPSVGLCAWGVCVTGKTLTSNETNFSCPLSEKGLMRSRGGVSKSRFEQQSSSFHLARVRFSCAFVCLPVPVCACALLGSAESMLYSHTALGCIRPDLISGVVVGCGGLLSRKEACTISRWHCVIKM